MNDSACARWVALADRAALGEPLSEQEQRIQREHEAECGSCRAERALYWQLDTVRDEAAVLTRPFALQQFDEKPVTLPRGRFGLRAPAGRKLAWGLAASAGVAVIATLTFRSLSPAPVASLPPTKVAFVVVSGAVGVGARQASAGVTPRLAEPIHVAAGRACLSFQPSVVTCLASGSDAALSSLAPERRALELRHGHVLAKLDPQPAGMTFRIETPRGAAIAKGTVFAVEVMESQTVLLRVHEGTVLWQGEDGHEQSLRAPSEARFGDTHSFAPLSANSAERDEALIRLSGLVSAESRCRLDVSATPPGARLSLDGTELGPAPASALVSGGHRLSIEHPGYVALSERLWLNGSAPISRSYQLSPLPAATAATAPPTTASPAPRAAPGIASVDIAPLPSAAELLARARSLRAAGRSADAAGAYRRLLNTYPRSDEARASLVSLGELLLSELGDPAGALRSFDSYLKAAGALTPEARYGRIRALGKLGRVGAERAAIEQFLLDYPRSVQATNLKAKLASLP